MGWRGKFRGDFGRLLPLTLGVAAAYALAGRLGLLLALPPGYVSAIFPASGIALACLLIYGNQASAGIWLGSFWMNAWVSLSAGSEVSVGTVLAASAAIGVGAMAQARLGAWLIRRYIGWPNPLAGEKEVFKFFLFGGVSCLFNATLGVLVLRAAGILSPASVWLSWGTWWVGDAIGVVVIAPVVLLWLGKPASQWASRRLSVTIPLTLAFCLTTLFYVYTSNYQQKNLQLEFRRKSAALLSAFGNSYDGHLEDLYTTRSLLAAFPTIDGKEFRQFTANLISHHPGIRAMGWAELVRDEDRAAYERSVSKAIGKPFFIAELGPRDEMIRAAKRPYYVVIRHIQPLEGKERFLGFDVASEAVRRLALDRAKETGKPISTGALEPIGNQAFTKAFPIFMPVYRSGREGQPEALRGYVSAGLRTDYVVESAIRNLDQQGIDFRVIDEMAPAASRVLYGHRAGSGQFQSGATFESGTPTGPIWDRGMLDVAGRRLVVLFGPTREYLHASTRWGAWFLMLGGLLFSALLGAFLLVATGRRQLVENLVQSRARELKDTSDRLAETNLELEAKVRDLRSSEERFRLLVSGVTDYAIFRLDADGRVVTWNEGAERIKGYAADEIIGQHFSKFYLPEQRLAGQPQKALEAARRDGRVEEVGWRIRRDGSRFWASALLAALRDAEGNLLGYAKITRDLTERKLQEEELEKRARAVKLLQLVSSAANRASRFDELLKLCLDEVCALTGWPVGHAYVMAKGSGGLLVPSGIWHLPPGDAYREFREVTDNFPMPMGVGLPGRVLARGEPIWIADVNEDADFPRAKVSRALGIQSGFGFPILVDKEVKGVLEFFSPESQAPDDALLEVVHHIGVQIGQVVRRQEVEDALKFSERKHRLVLETVYDAFVGMDDKGIITDWNLQAEVTFGWKKEEAVGRLIAETIVPPRFREAHAQGLKRFLATGRGPVLNRRFELSAIHKDGHEFPVELTISPVRIDGGFLFSAFIHDIRDRKRSEEALKRSEERYRSLVDSAQDMVSTTHLDGTFLTLNPAFETITGWPRSEWLGRSFESLVHPDDLGQVMNVRKRVLEEGGQYVRSEVRIVTRSGQTKVVEAMIKPVREGSRIVGLFSVARDVTVRREAEEALKRAREDLERQVAERTSQLRKANDELKNSNAQLEQFASIASHDLREPLRTISNYVALLSREYGPKLDTEAAGYFSYVVDAAKRMQLLISDLLDYSRLGSSPEVRDEVNCNSVIRKVLGDLDTPILESKAEVRVGDLPKLLGDSVQIGRLFQNLVSNSLKYKSSRPLSIDIGCGKTGDAWLFWVKDNGIGFDPNQAERIFEIFRRLHAKDEYPGTGIGLAVCRKIVERHGGKIWAESTEGVGSTFYFTIPDLLKSLPLEGMGVLLVDDAKDIQICVGRALRELGGAVVDVAAHGGEGVRLAKERPYDLVLMDINMPVKDGFEATSELRRQGFSRPIVAFTSQKPVGGRTFYTDRGFTDYLDKGDDLSRLVDRLVKFRADSRPSA